MNEKGQTLVLFLIIIPVISFLFIYLFEIGSIKIDKKKIESAIEESLEYGLDNLEEENLQLNIQTILLKTDDEINIDDIQIDVIGQDLNIVVRKEYDNFIIKEEVVFNYTGYMEDNNIVIVKNRG